MNAKRILIVEDDDDIVELLAFNLRAAGFATESARDGYEALSKARHGRRQPASAMPRARTPRKTVRII